MKKIALVFAILVSFGANAQMTTDSVMYDASFLEAGNSKIEDSVYVEVHVVGECFGKISPELTKFTAHQDENDAVEEARENGLLSKECLNVFLLTNSKCHYVLWQKNKWVDGHTSSTTLDFGRKVRVLVYN